MSCLIPYGKAVNSILSKIWTETMKEHVGHYCFQSDFFVAFKTDKGVHKMHICVFLYCIRCFDIEKKYDA